MNFNHTPVSLETFHSEIRARFPSLEKDSGGEGRLYLNTAAGSLTVEDSIRALCQGQRELNPMPGSISDGELKTTLVHQEVRHLVRGFLNAWSDEEISFHFSATAALFNLAFSMLENLNPAVNIIVTDLDHMANISPWEWVGGKLADCHVKRARVTDKGTLDTDHLLSLVNQSTSVVAMTAAANSTGSLMPLEKIARAIREKKPDCFIVVDAVHLAPHCSIDVQEFECDFLVFSGYKVFGPMISVLWGKRSTLEKLNPYRVETNKNQLPYKFEMGMLNNASIAGLGGALKYLLWISDKIAGPEAQNLSLNKRFKLALAAIKQYEQKLSCRILERIATYDPDRIKFFGPTIPEESSIRTPTFIFDIKDRDAASIKKKLWNSRRMQIADGNHYSAFVVRHLKKPEGLARASFGHYDRPQDADLFADSLEELIDEK